eukprot:m.61983 g.61983  ORF g.61983 m.61983 type:complete len:470 (-) comp15783_c0_seq6:118-1527(-)
MISSTDENDSTVSSILGSKRDGDGIFGSLSEALATVAAEANVEAMCTGDDGVMNVLRREVIKVHQLWKETEKARAESEAMRDRLESHCLRLQSAHDELLNRVELMKSEHNASTAEVGRLHAANSALESAAGLRGQERDDALERLQALQQQYDRTLTVSAAKDELIALQKMKIDILTLDPATTARTRIRDSGLEPSGPERRDNDVTTPPRRGSGPHKVQAKSDTGDQRGTRCRGACNSGGSAMLGACEHPDGAWEQPDGAWEYPPTSTAGVLLCCCRPTMCGGNDVAGGTAQVAQRSRGTTTTADKHAEAATKYRRECVHACALGYPQGSSKRAADTTHCMSDRHCGAHACPRMPTQEECQACCHAPVSHGCIHTTARPPCAATTTTGACAWDAGTCESRGCGLSADWGVVQRRMRAPEVMSTGHARAGSRPTETSVHRPLSYASPEQWTQDVLETARATLNRHQKIFDG